MAGHKLMTAMQFRGNKNLNSIFGMLKTKVFVKDGITANGEATMSKFRGTNTP